MSEIQQQLSVLSRQLGQLASRFTDSERQRSGEVANAAAMQAAQKAEGRAAKGAGNPRVERSHVFLSRSPESFGGEVVYYWLV